MRLVRDATMTDARGITHFVWWNGLRNPYGWRRRCDNSWLTSTFEHEKVYDNLVVTCVLCAVRP